MAAAAIDLSLAKTGSAGTPTTGGTYTFTLTLANAGGLNDATGVVVTDTLPSRFAFNSFAGAEAGNAVHAGGVVTWTPAAPVASGSSLTPHRGSVTQRRSFSPLRADQRSADLALPPCSARRRHRLGTMT